MWAVPEAPLERMLAKAVASGVLTQYDTGRGQCGWMQGPPGEAMRKLRTDVLEWLKAYR